MSTTSSPVASTTPLPTPPSACYHPEFTGSSGLNADVTLVARDGMCFRINAAALKLASGVFETTLSLPQSVDTDEWKEPVIDSLDEDAQVLGDLLRIISGKEILPDRLISLDALQPRLLAAEKWDMRAALSIMRALLRTNPSISTDPMRVYWLGCHFGWKDVTSTASKYSCHDDLFLAHKQSLLARVDVTDLLRLMNFHKARKDQMKTHLFDNVATPSNWCSHSVLNTEYQDFAWRVLEEMDHTPPAGRLSGNRLHSFCEKTDMKECRCRSCGSSLLSVQDTIQRVQRHWAGLQAKLTV